MYDPLPETYSEGMRGLIASMLQKEVRKRPTANELLQVWGGGELPVGDVWRWSLGRKSMDSQRQQQGLTIRPAPLSAQHPLIVAKVRAYLDALSAGGSGWSTWRMKLPPSILVQMAQIIARASCSGAAPPDASADVALPADGSVGVTAVSSDPHHCPVPRHIEDLMSSEELIEKFGLQSLLEPSPRGGAEVQPGGDAVPRGGHREKHAALLAAALHPDDGKKLHLAGAERQGVCMCGCGWEGGGTIWLSVVNVEQSTGIEEIAGIVGLRLVSALDF